MIALFHEEVCKRKQMFYLRHSVCEKNHSKGYKSVNATTANSRCNSISDYDKSLLEI